jgi:hypothetical protein
MSLALSGCQDILNSLLDNGAPTGVNASDGDYKDSIEVSWGAPNLSSDKWKGSFVTGYSISWSGPAGASGSARTSGTGCSIPVASANRAQYFDVTVTSEITGDAGSGASDYDTGFAMDAKELIWPDAGATYNVSGTEQWYMTMLQKGFAYSFDFGPGTGVVEFYPFKTLDLDHAELAAAAPAWTCDENGASHKFYVRVQPSASSGFFAKCDLGFGF